MAGGFIPRENLAPLDEYYENGVRDRFMSTLEQMGYLKVWETEKK